MKLLHLADLHFGKSLHSRPLLDDQEYWVERMLEAVDREKPDAVLIAGDVYDRGVPGREAVGLLSYMLTALSARGIEVMLTAGNHDGGERLEFASELLAPQRVHIAGTVRKEAVRVVLKDEHGPVNFWLMPYTTPAAVRTVLELTDEEAGSFDSAVAALIEAQSIDTAERNVLIGHQTVVSGQNNPLHSASETAIGGVGGVDAKRYELFDYTALGHIHGAQSIGSDRVRYAGAPLCYHFDEAGQKKGLLWVELGAKGEEVKTRTEELPSLHRVLRPIKGQSADIIADEEANPTEGAYVSVVLTDEYVRPDIHDTLRSLYESHGSCLLELGREYRRASLKSPEDGQRAETLSLSGYFQEFFALRSPDGRYPDRQETELIEFLARQIEDRPDALEAELVEALAAMALEQAAETAEEEAER